jgi:putative effector of murein hydrolase LrgA (UPF0299 family)
MYVETTSDGSFFPILAVVLGSLCSLLLVSAAIAVFFYRKKRSQTEAVRKALIDSMV